MWQLMPGLALRYRTWDNETYVLYNNLSGDTHLTDAAAIEVLEVLRQSPVAVAALATALQLDATPDNLAQLDCLLGELQGQALVESLPAC
ncbi:HPr-rel-A system PqqD family peptide chaperone [Duganella sp. FT92W]|uniref:HPr-rel-A system PqqD family peptide chaperone n=1 Tax=Pseudoduganella rivuli TaxID=2666085 RepID=A0A7X2IUV9_9BURK|nr:HPr-rel-A system PqqD family peptide chaperone [Pseudoduganella rivuli]MRV76449.1 HPr-rel-A system PqqD family peptide chaperone [Pseudoduganella rivuli]